MSDPSQPTIIVHSTASVGRAIRAARRRLSITQSQLAEMSGVSQPMISSIERGGGVSVGTLLRLVPSLGLELVIQPRPDKDVLEAWESES